MSNEQPAPRVPRFGPDAIRTPANVVTIVRLLFTIPVLMMILDGEPGSESWATFMGWWVLWVTDWLDGWLARRDGTTRSGAFLDPLADKVLVMGGLVTLAVRGDFAWLPVVIIGVREVFISVYRSMAARRGVSMPARPLGKWKATVQYFAIAAALFPPTADTPWVADAALWVAVGLTVVSGVDLVVNAARRTSTGDAPRVAEPSDPPTS
ncbi:MAG: CDP-diacylglycerol--glycerol-3-phosphate 3-phosphatidyltransferase [Actinomycetota bacterium]